VGLAADLEGPPDRRGRLRPLLPRPSDGRRDSQSRLLVLLRTQGFLNCPEFLLSHSRSGIPKHLQEPIDLPGLKGMADTTAVFSIGIGGSNRVDDQGALTIQESEERNEGRPTQASEQGIGPRSVDLFCSGLLLHAEMHNHEVLIDDGFDGIRLDETIEFMAPASPRSVKIGENGPLPDGCLSLRSFQQRGSSCLCLRIGWHSGESPANRCGGCHAVEGPAAEHILMIVPQPWKGCM
jgi:hypothetical protein